MESPGFGIGKKRKANGGYFFYENLTLPNYDANINV